jgi:hypothetical protein
MPSVGLDPCIAAAAVNSNQIKPKTVRFQALAPNVRLRLEWSSIINERMNE